MIKRLSFLLVVLLVVSCGSYKKSSEEAAKKTEKPIVTPEEPTDPQPQEPLFNNANDKQAAIFIHHLLTHLPVYFKNAITTNENEPVSNPIGCIGYDVNDKNTKVYEPTKKDNVYTINFKNCTLSQDIVADNPSKEELYSDLCAEQCSSDNITAPYVEYRVFSLFGAPIEGQCPADGDGAAMNPVQCSNSLYFWETNPDCTDSNGQGDTINKTSKQTCQDWRDRVATCNTCKLDADASLNGLDKETFTFYPYPTDNYEFTIDGKIEITINDEDGSASLTSSDITIKEEDNFIPTALDCNLEAKIENFTSVFEADLLNNISNNYDFWNFLKNEKEKIKTLRYTGTTCGYSFGEMLMTTPLLEDVMAYNLNTNNVYKIVEIINEVPNDILDFQLVENEEGKEIMEASFVNKNITTDCIETIISGKLTGEIFRDEENNPKNIIFTSNNFKIENVICSVNVDMDWNTRSLVGEICGTNISIENMSEYLEEFCPVEEPEEL